MHQALQASEQLLAHERSLLEEVQRPDGDGCSVDECAAALVPSHTVTPLNPLIVHPSQPADGTELASVMHPACDPV